MNKRFMWFAPLAAVVVGWLPHEILNDYNHLPLHLAAVSSLILVFAVAVIFAVSESNGQTGFPAWLLAAPVLLYTFVDIVVFVSLISLLRPGQEAPRGWTLLGSAAIAWTINLMCFSLWYWTLDFALRDRESESELGFPGKHADANGILAFADYAYLALNTGLAFSTTDVSPLTTRMRLVMMCNGGTAFVIVVIAAARAVGAM